MDYFFSKGVAESTKRSYAVARARYHRFCEGKGVPVSEPVVCAFVASLALEGLAGASIKVYLAGVRQAQVEKGFPDPNWGRMQRLGQVLKGIRRHQSERGLKKRVRHPVSPEVIMQLRGCWQKKLDFDSTMLWAAVCLCYFGCLRAGEISAPERGMFDPGADLTFGDVVVDSFHDPRKVTVRIKASKTDPFREGTDVYFGRTGQPLCPVSAVLAYMVRRKEGARPTVPV